MSRHTSATVSNVYRANFPVMNKKMGDAEVVCTGVLLSVITLAWVVYSSKSAIAMAE